MPEGSSRAERKDRFVAVVDQDKVTDEVRDIALKYDPLNQAGANEGFHVTEDGELHIEDAKVIEEHRIVANKVPGEAIRILRLPAERGELVHQYGENGFRLYELPAPSGDRVVGLLGPNGVGKTTALRVLDGSLRPNLGRVDDPPDWDEIVREFRGTAAQHYLEKLREGEASTAYKPQRVDRLPEHHEGTPRELLARADERGLGEEALERLGIEHVADRELGELSGGELQRLAIAATLVADVDTYLVDEPSSYLDVGQRLTVARSLTELAEDREVILVDHDLVALDVAADDLHLFYGEPTGFGVVSRPLSARRGINAFLEGRLEDENVRIREEALAFHEGSARRSRLGATLLAVPRLRKSFEGFSLTVEPAEIHASEVLGIVGPNGLGKTTFAKLLAGHLEPEEGRVAEDVRIAYKPQYLEPTFEGTVGELMASQVDVHNQAFEARIHGPFGLESLWEEDVQALSGGERQRVGIALALARDAEVYLLDEPSAYLDVERRVELAAQLRRFARRGPAPCLVIDHDLMLLDAVCDRLMVFEGEPGRQGLATAPCPVREGLDRFLADVGITFRRDPRTGRPRANDPGSRKDREQKARGEYYAA